MLSVGAGAGAGAPQAAGNGGSNPFDVGDAGNHADAAASAADDGGGLGILAAVGDGLEWLHGATGLPWWAVIAGVTVAVRCALVPLAVDQLRYGARLSGPQPARLMAGLQQALAREPRPTTLAGAIRQRRAHGKQVLKMMRALWKKFDCHPARAYLLAPAVQIPVLVTFILGTRRLLRGERDSTLAAAGYDVPGAAASGDAAAAAADAVASAPALEHALHSEGLWWFADLAAADPTYALPAVAYALTYTNLRINLSNSSGLVDVSKFRDALLFLLCAASPVTFTLPAGVFCYWIPSAAFGLAQGAVLRTDGVRARLGLPPIPKGKPPGGANGRGAPPGMGMHMGGATVDAQSHVVAPPPPDGGAMEFRAPMALPGAPAPRLGGAGAVRMADPLVKAWSVGEVRRRRRAESERGGLRGAASDEKTS